MRNTVLIVAAHPDDEVLGCGGTIAKMVSEGDKVHVAFLADGVSSRSCKSEDKASALLRRRLAAKSACDILGVTSVFFGDFPDNQMDTISLLDVVRQVENLVDKLQPNMLFTHHVGDVNIDHQVVHQAVITACRPQKHHPVKTLLFFEIPSSTEWQVGHSAPAFIPNWYVDISNTLELKLNALNVYSEELRSWPHTRSVRGVTVLSSWRGATVGVESAEAFMLGRKLR
jgi:N-acetylglucosamine malate deacetylase 1